MAKGFTNSIIGGSEGLYAWEKYSVEYTPAILNKKLADLPFTFEGQTVVYNGELHALCNVINDQYYIHYKWDGTTWTSVSTLPYNASGGCAVVYNNEIHILGGYKEHYKWNGSTWQEVGELPYKFNNGCAVVYNNEIHILGGVNYRQYHYKWDGSTWTQSASVYVSGGYEGLMAGNAVVYNDAIYVFGGSDGYYTEGAKWNGGDSWEQADTDVHVIGGSAVVYKDKIHILGSSSSGYETQHYTWDGASETVALEALPYDFEGDQGIVYNDEIHILGGDFNTSHYIINGYLPSYTFKDYIVSDKADAYPNDGEQGGYYYKSVGKLDFECGVVTLSEAMDSITITHNLKAVPTYCSLVNTDKVWSSYASRVLAICTGGALARDVVTSDTYFTSTSTNVTFNQLASYSFPKGATYLWAVYK